MRPDWVFHRHFLDLNVCCSLHEDVPMPHHAWPFIQTSIYTLPVSWLLSWQRGLILLSGIILSCFFQRLFSTSTANDACKQWNSSISISVWRLYCGDEVWRKKQCSRFPLRRHRGGLITYEKTPTSHFRCKPKCMHHHFLSDASQTLPDAAEGTGTSVEHDQSRIQSIFQ